MPDSPKVFISYSHDSDEHRRRVLDLADRLRDDGVEAWIDQYEESFVTDWQRWMNRQIEAADFVLLICTEIYRRRFEGKETVGSKGADWEGRVLTQESYDRSPKPIVPVVFDPADEIHRPTGFRSGDFFVLKPEQGFTIGDHDGYQLLFRKLTHQPLATAGPVGPPKVLPSRPRPAHHPSSPDVDSDDPLTRYRAWAEKHHSRLRMIGLDAGDVQVRLDEIYVPLRVADRGRLGVLDSEGSARDDLRALGKAGLEEFEVHEAFRQGDGRHLLIFGEPGSGKTTALQKLHQLCWRDPEGLGLETGTVPVFLRLRHLNRALLEGDGLAAVVDRELLEVSGQAALEGSGESLWDHGRLLLLFDGLDEIADENERTSLLGRILWASSRIEDARVVVSCRRASLPDAESDRDGRFGMLEVRPLQDAQIHLLVDVWFREMARLGKITDAQAHERVEMLRKALDSKEGSTRKILELVSNPLLLTLLCVVFLLSGEIPKERARFYERCLEVLLERWPARRGHLGPTDLAGSIRALSRLAFFLHSRGRRDNLLWATAVKVLKEELGDRETANTFFQWCRRDAGILVAATGTQYGFVHLSLQEYLTALHLLDDSDRFEVLAGDLDEDWWREVLLQVAASSKHSSFVAMTQRLLRHTEVWRRQAELLKDCLREVSRPDLTAFEEALANGEPDLQVAVLRLLWPVRNQLPEPLVDHLRGLVGEGPETVRPHAQRLLDGREPDSLVTDRIAILYDSESAEGWSDRLATALRTHPGGCEPCRVRSTSEQAFEILKSCGTGIILLGVDDSTGDDEHAIVELFDELTWLVVRLPAEVRAEVPTALESIESWDWEVGQEQELAVRIFELHEAPIAEKLIATDRRSTRSAALAFSVDDEDSEPYEDPITGQRFLYVPGGEFLMGQELTPEEASRLHESWVKSMKPVHRVQVSSYRLAETAVTNRQYGLFLEASGHEEPSEWRNRRFNAPDQPVVGVSWEDAKTFCEWLTRENGNKYRFDLPTEAQWEFAARGPESLMYPWGNEPPTAELADFNQDYSKGKPATAGSFPKGVGPFEHLDLAGGVWDWCLDLWDPTYEGREDGCLDPIGSQDDSLRPLRGGSWLNPASFLRSAFRNRFRPGNRVGGFGFRVSCAPSES